MLDGVPFKTPPAESYKHLQHDATLGKLLVCNTPIYQTTTHNTVFQ
jgi:energy-converting hydrogenase Eha subunit F